MLVVIQLEGLSNTRPNLLSSKHLAALTDSLVTGKCVSSLLVPTGVLVLSTWFALQMHRKRQTIP